MEGTDSERSGVIAPPPLIYAAALAGGLAVHAVRNAPLLPGGPPRALGWLLVGSAMVLAPAAIATLRRAGTTVDPYAPTTAIVTEGPFRFSRNPIYLAFTFLYAGIALLANARSVAALLPLVLVVIRFGVIGREERYLERRFGDEYRSYRDAVRRWV